MSKDILVPNIGDFKDVEVIEVLVKVGQKIKKNDSLITIESDKSSVEVPSTSDGVIEKINMKIGDKVSEGDLILTVDEGSKTDVKVQPLQKNKVKEEETKKLFSGGRLHPPAKTKRVAPLQEKPRTSGSKLGETCH